MEKKAKIVFEVSWEVCNKVGGIHTVLSSKAAQMVANYGEHYYLIGPYFGPQSVHEFSEELPKEFCKDAFEELKKEGIICHFGKWSIEGSPSVILIDFDAVKNKINDIKRYLWDHFQVDSMRAGYDYDEPVAWSFAVGKVLEVLTRCLATRDIVAQFHEWLSGAGLLYLKSIKAPIATVFTTHATVLGRSIAMSGADLYTLWDNIDADKEAYGHFVESKHMIEKQSALNASIFTTVSEITSMEAERLLGRKADVLVLNGLDIDKFPTFEEISIKHKAYREKIREFIISYFFPYYTFDTRESLLFFTAARYEFENKGIDIMIEALSKLNESMKKSNSQKTVIAFFFIPAAVKHINQSVLENKTYYQYVRESFEDEKEDIENNIMRALVTDTKVNELSLFDAGFMHDIKQKLKRFRRQGLPPLCTHELQYQNDAILSAFQRAGLQNKPQDPVKVIFYPMYLSGADNLLNLTYYETMQGSHLGIFPSYYEPWGYTPLEAGALGVSSITSDVAGFGRFFCNECVQGKSPGIFVLQRLKSTKEQSIQELANILLEYQALSKQDRTQNKLQARRIAQTCDWRSFIDNYVQAHNLAIKKQFQ